MITPIRWLWQQFTGKHITMVATGIYRAITAQVDSIITYFHSLSLDTAVSAHLTLFGAAMGIVRPIIAQAPEKYFWFTRNPEHDDVHGVSELVDGKGGPIGGMFSDLYDPEFTWSNALAPTEPYRRLLKAVVGSEGEIGSLVLVDDIIAAFSSRPVESYRFYSEEHSGNDTRTNGDIEMLIGSDDIFGSETTLTQAMIQGVVNEAYAPEFLIDVNIGTGKTGEDGKPLPPDEQWD